MVKIIELLNDEEIKKIAKLLKVNTDILQDLPLDKVKHELYEQQVLLRKENQATQLNEVNTLIDKLKSWEEEDWKNVFNNPNQSTNDHPEEKTSEGLFNNTDHSRHYYSAGISDCTPYLLGLTGNTETQKTTRAQLETGYKRITGKQAETKTYATADELPDNLKDSLSNKAFPLHITHFQFTDAKQFQTFHNEVIAPLKVEGKLTELTKEPILETTAQHTDFRPSPLTIRG
jgi:hypothetical protein